MSSNYTSVMHDLNLLLYMIYEGSNIDIHEMMVGETPLLVNGNARGSHWGEK